MKTSKNAVLALGGILGTLAFLFILSRLWPFIAGSLLQRGMQSKMHCWVRVVDQEDNGVRGYKCRVVEEHTPLWPFSTGKDVVRVFETGDDGSFEYTSKGTTGRVFFGYSWDAQWALNSKNLLQERNLRVTSLEYQQGIRDSPAEYLGSKGNPYLLHVFSVGSPQKLLYWKERVTLEELGSYACIDLLSGRIWESKTPGGDVAIADGLFGKNRELPRCFHYVVAGAHCSVAPVLDDWGLCPPENGYQQELCAPKDWESRKWSSNEIQFYFRLMNKKTGGVVYGRLTLGLSPRVQNAEIETYTNLQGERNLFYKGYTDLMDQKILDFVSPPVQ